MAEQTLQVALAHESAATRNTLHAAVAQLGHTVCLHAANGRELVERSRPARPDLFIVQEDLPETDGLEAVQEASGRESVPIVVILDRHDGVMTGRPEAANVLAVLQQPVRPSDLIPVIPLVMGHFRRLRRLRESIALLKSEIDGGS